MQSIAGCHVCTSQLFRSPLQSRRTTLRSTVVAKRWTVQAQPSSSDALAPKMGGPVCIAGGGPAGLAAALMLARRGWKDITIIEKKEVIGAEDNQRSYVYMIDGRGRKLLSRMPGMVDCLDDFGVSTAAINIMRVMPDGDVKRNEIAIKDPKRVNHFMPRPSFLKLLLEKGLQQEWAQAANITLLTNTEVEAISRTTGQQGSNGSSSNISSSSGHQAEAPLYVKAVRRDSSGNSETIELRPSLLIGADGQSSMVRTTLQQWEKEDGAATDGGRFATKEFSSPAGGLRYKILRLPPNPVASSRPDAPPLLNPSFAILVGKALGAGSALRALRLGLLPIRDPNASRTANLITKPDHKVWEVTGTEEMYSMLQSSMPQVRFRELVPPEVMEQFATSRGGRFPQPQLCEGLHYLVSAGDRQHDTEQQGMGPQGGGAAEGSSSVASSSGAAMPGTAGVLLIGDARGSFPPDLGQGVNSALEDVDELAQVLDRTGDNLSEALPLYERQRAPHIAALIQLMTFSYPWQYNQDPVQRFLWTINFTIRAFLSKALPAIFSPHSFMLVQVSSLSYKQVLDLAHATTQRLYALFGGLALGVAIVVGKGLKASAVGA
ncbi:hypothetical protein DUNSADRAFT_8601 [Dunaliella salina]|uniref:FAD-binding domain-containing protein n=1 Tax=Dunaliella salina TaxID=3046 RepID=A0ABQ7H5X0_DUNSA|nr:hypothetical protein DUNSADRAFT_8601 [Dunaliella salina]|eukprot:KAF5842201.1 hypothetical protein DUNSADRAFT_8601 [Dunaliella salina]